MKGLLRLALLASVGAFAGMGIGGCGSGSSKQPAGDHVSGTTLRIYTALPLSGASAATARAIVRGEQIALAQYGGKIGRYRISLVVRNDAGDSTAGWNAPSAAAAAQQVARDAAADRHTVAFIGDLTAGASAVAIPILNRSGIVQVTPAATAVGLTSNGVGSTPGEPEAYYPSNPHTFARVLGTDAGQAAVQAEIQRADGCHSTYVLDDGEYDGLAMTTAFSAVAPKYGVHIFNTAGYVVGAKDYSALGVKVAQSGANCVLIAATSDHNAVQVASQVATLAPSAKLFVTMGLAQASFFDPAAGGIPKRLDSRVTVTAVPLDPASTDAVTKPFLDGFGRAAYERQPLAAAGYQAMALVLGAIDDATDGGHGKVMRTHIVGALFDGVWHSGLFGRYRIESDGDSSIESFGVYGVKDGQLHFERILGGGSS